ncbi:hypothetical protein VUR80DRAFT_92 [Thermomyces stellatus]
MLGETDIRILALRWPVLCLLSFPRHCPQSQGFPGVATAYQPECPPVERAYTRRACRDIRCWPTSARSYGMKWPHGSGPKRLAGAPAPPSAAWSRCQRRLTGLRPCGTKKQGRVGSVLTGLEMASRSLPVVRGKLSHMRRFPCHASQQAVSGWPHPAAARPVACMISRKETERD